MTEAIIQYDTMVQRALLCVVKDVLKDTVQKGLLGNHHFYLTFNTKHPETIIPPYLKERYPEEMTIVIQNQFSNLLVDDDHFEISLSFNGKLDHLSIPFLALEGFFDPSVDFGLHFHTPEGNNNNQEIISPTAKTTPPPNNNGKEETSDNVVTLDAFRKK